MLTSRISGAPICAGEASPLRVATGGSANWSSGVRSRRSPARANRRRDSVSRGLENASLLQSSENHGKKLTHIGHLFMTNTRASLRSDNCPISIGMGVRFGLEQVSAFVGIRSLVPCLLISVLSLESPGTWFQRSSFATDSGYNRTGAWWVGSRCFGMEQLPHRSPIKHQDREHPQNGSKRHRQAFHASHHEAKGIVLSASNAPSSNQDQHRERPTQ
jgi:hypothetical protein